MNTKNRFLYIFPILFAILTLIITIYRIPFWDEARAFEIARLNLPQIFYMTRIEGHSFLWYLILKSFSSIKLYPYPMYIINWFLCTSAIFILWKKSPFSTLVKFLITFSTPFVFYFAPVARCYSIGILFLFLICSEFKNRFKKSKLFSTLLFVCSNTSILAFIPCFYLWIIYLFQLFKRKSKNFKTVFFFFVLNILLFFAQFLKTDGFNTNNLRHNAFAKLVFNFFNLLNNNTSIILVVFKIIVYMLFIYGTIHLFKKSKYALCFFLSTYSTLTLLFLLVYSGSLWNYFFYYIYFIVLCWIFYRQIFSDKLIKFLIASVYIFMLFSFSVFGQKIVDYAYSSKSRYIADFIVNNINKNTKLYCLDWWSDISPGADIYLLKKGVHIYDLLGYKRTSFESIKNIFLYRRIVVDIGSFYDSFNENESIYLVSDGTMFENFINTSKKNHYYIKPVIENKNLNVGIYELVKK